LNTFTPVNFSSISINTGCIFVGRTHELDFFENKLFKTLLKCFFSAPTNVSNAFLLKIFVYEATHMPIVRLFGLAVGARGGIASKR